MTQIHLKTLIKNKRKKGLISTWRQFTTYIIWLVMVVVMWYFIGSSMDTSEIQVGSALDTSICPHAPMGMILSDCEALIDFYNSTDGDNWTNTWWRWTTWWTWYGITVSWDRVSEINITWDNGLSWSISGEILSTLTWLIKIDIANQTNLSGYELPIIHDLPILTYLRFHNNNFIGTIPETWSWVDNLEYLRISLNHLNWTIPNTLTWLNNIRWLSFWWNWLVWNIPNIRSDYEFLESLDLSSNNLYGEIPDSIFNLENLINVNFSSNQLSGFIIWDRPNLTWITSALRLNSNHFSWALPALLSANIWIDDDIYFFNPWLCGLFPEDLVWLIDDYSSYDAGDLVNWQLCSEWLFCNTNADCESNTCTDNLCIWWWEPWWSDNKPLNITKTVSGDYNFMSWETAYFHLDWSNTWDTTYTGQIIDHFGTGLTYLTSTILPTEVNNNTKNIIYSGVVFGSHSTGRITIWFTVQGQTWDIIYNTWYMYVFSGSNEFYTWYNNYWYNYKHINITWDIEDEPEDLLGITKTINGRWANWQLITWWVYNSEDIIEYKLHWEKYYSGVLPIMIKDYFSTGTLDFHSAVLSYNTWTNPSFQTRSSYNPPITNSGELTFIFTWNSGQNISGDVLVRFRVKWNSGDLLANTGTIWFSWTDDVVYDDVTYNNTSYTWAYIWADRDIVSLYINKTSNKDIYLSWELVTWSINFGNTWDVVCENIKLRDYYSYYATWSSQWQSNTWHFDFQPSGTIWWYNYTWSTWTWLTIDIWTLGTWQTGSITLTGIANWYRISNIAQLTLSWDCVSNTNINYTYKWQTYSNKIIDIFKQNWFDLALKKYNSSYNTLESWSIIYQYITVYNQWSEPASDINIIDYPWTGMIFNSNYSISWWMISGNNYIYHYTGTIAPRSSRLFSIAYQLNKTWSIDTYAEIYSASGWVDIDSTPDAIRGNDGNVIDDELEWNGFLWQDEDDHDIDTIYVYDQWAPDDLVDVAHRSVFIWKYPYSSWSNIGTDYRFRLYFFNQWMRNITTIHYEADIFSTTWTSALTYLIDYITWLYLYPWQSTYVDLSFISTWVNHSSLSGRLLSEISHMTTYSWSNYLLNQINHTWDIDSIFYDLWEWDDLWNDPLIDDEIWLTPAQWDEDDHDIAYFGQPTNDTTPTLSIIKTANTWTTASGTVVTYTLSYSSNTLCPWVTIEDILPPTSRFVFGWAMHNGVSVWSIIDNIWRYNIGALQANTTWSITITWIVYGNTNDTIINTGTIRGNCIATTSTATASVNIQNPINTSITADLYINKEIIKYGNPTVYKITYRNNGPHTATWVVVSEVLPSGVFASVVYSTNPINNQWSLGNLTSWTSGTIIVTGNLTTNWNWSYTNTVTIGSTTYDNNLTNNTSFITTSYNNTTSNSYVDLWVSKSVSNIYIAKWSNFNWIINYKNHGNKTAYDVCITDSIPNWITYISNSANLTIQYLWSNQIKLCVWTLYAWQEWSFNITTRWDTVWVYNNYVNISWSENINTSNDSSYATVTIHEPTNNIWTNNTTTTSTSEDNQTIIYLQNQVNALKNQISETYNYLSNTLSANWQANISKGIWVSILPKTWASR